MRTVTTSKGRPRKYRTQAERVRARKEAAERWYAKNKVYSVKTIKRWTELGNLIKTGMKFCPRCEEDLPATDDYFYPRPASIDGFTTYCRDCQSELSTENYYRNKKLKKAVRVESSNGLRKAHKRSL